MFWEESGYLDTEQVSASDFYQKANQEMESEAVVETILEAIKKAQCFHWKSKNCPSVGAKGIV